MLLVGARDAAGNDTVEVRSGFCDSIPPQPLSAELVRARSRRQEGGAPGRSRRRRAQDADPPGSNPRTGQSRRNRRALPTAPSPRRLLAAEGDQLVAVAIDAYRAAKASRRFCPSSVLPVICRSRWPGCRRFAGRSLLAAAAFRAAGKGNRVRPKKNLYSSEPDFLAFLPAVALPEIPAGRPGNLFFSRLPCRSGEPRPMSRAANGKRLRQCGLGGYSV